MKYTKVLEIYKLLSESRIRVWLDGGWGVDALLERQTRNHSDMDIVIQKSDLKKLNTILKPRGFAEMKGDDSSDWNFVLGDKKGVLIDVHVVEFDSKGDGIYGPKENGVYYPKASFNGTGKINGYGVKCLTPEYQVISHTGYAIDNDDYNDVLALCKKFNIKLPEEYKKFT